MGSGLGSLLLVGVDGAVAAGARLPAGQGTELLHAAREAFTVSLHVTGVVAAVIFAGLAALILTMRPTRARDSGHGQRRYAVNRS